MINVQEFFVAQTQPTGLINEWSDCDHEWFDTNDKAQDWADVLREELGIDVRVVRRWK